MATKGRKPGTKNKPAPSLMQLIREYGEAQYIHGKAVENLAVTGADDYRHNQAAKKVNDAMAAIENAVGGFHGFAT